MKKILLIIYCALFLIPCAFFSLGMLIPGAANPAEGAEIPSFFTESPYISINSDFGNQFEEYFSKSFAYRNKVVDLFSAAKIKFFSEGNEQVIVGKDDFLFFADTLDNFIGSEPMTDLEINAAADSLSSIYDYSLAHGADFLFVCAPNKNSIYPEMMPSRYIMDTENRDMDRLFDALDERDVPYIDLRETLVSAKDDLLVYHKRDSHWNTEGARIALEAIADTLSLTLPDFSKYDKTLVTDFQGDLDTLLFPERKMYDNNTEYDLSELFLYTSAYQTAMDMQITARGSGEGKLLMFRDSFANAMLPFWASSFSESRFERAVPYRVDLLETYAADCVIIQIAERNIRTLIGSDERIETSKN